MTDGTYAYMLTHAGAGMLASRGMLIIASDEPEAIGAYAEYMRCDPDDVRLISTSDHSAASHAMYPK